MIRAYGFIRSRRDAARPPARRSTWHVREIVAWHFDPSTGCPFWLDYAASSDGTRARRSRASAISRASAFSRTNGCAAGRCSAGCRKGCAGKPVFVFETGGTTGMPKTRVAFDDFRIDYELFSDTLPEQYFPKGANWLMLGPSGPRRLRLSVEHLAQYRGGICFCVDLDPRWVIKLIKKGWSEHLEAYKAHVIDQAVTILQAGHDIKCLFTTPKLLEALALRLESMGTTIRKAGITGIFSGGTEFTPQWNRFAHEELLDGAYMTPTYGNTLMGLAASAPDAGRTTTTRSPTTHRSRAPSSRSSTSTTPTHVVEYGQHGPRQADDAHEGILRARLPRTRRRRARAALRQVSLGRHQRRQAVSRRRTDDDGRRVLIRRLRGGPFTVCKEIL